MNPIKDDITKASRQIGLTDSQADNLWQALQEIQTNRPKSGFLTALLYVGAIIAFLSMTWFYTAHLENSYSLLISIAYALIFFLYRLLFLARKETKDSWRGAFFLGDHHGSPNCLFAAKCNALVANIIFK
ncbi:MAG: hypothetical protein COT85_01180 [Chlamydiae bacterium CG10_big_fil_rev_8_21_14_0_10_42_34]|nr:MAG: hypothetical protein COT85_01180 [Chlamydiae bacterium CG10_big_fil_rev_8_21_14_0_10_42_34]